MNIDLLSVSGHKFHGPKGTGFLYVKEKTKLHPMILGGGQQKGMRSGTDNVPGIAGLGAGLAYLKHTGIEGIQRQKYKETEYCIHRLGDMGIKVYSGSHQCGTLSFVPDEDCELVAERLAKRGIAVRGGLHCAPLAHESAGTLETGTVRVSFGHDANRQQTEVFLREMQRITKKI